MRRKRALLSRYADITEETLAYYPSNPKYIISSKGMCFKLISEDEEMFYRKLSGAQYRNKKGRWVTTGYNLDSGYFLTVKEIMSLFDNYSESLETVKLKKHCFTQKADISSRIKTEFISSIPIETISERYKIPADKIRVMLTRKNIRVTSSYEPSEFLIQCLSMNHYTYRDMSNKDMSNQEVFAEYLSSNLKEGNLDEYFE